MISIEQCDVTKTRHFFYHPYPTSIKVNGDVFCNNSAWNAFFDSYRRSVDIKNGLVEKQYFNIQRDFSLVLSKEIIDTQAAQCNKKLFAKSPDTNIDRTRPTQIFDFFKNHPYDRKELRATIHNYRTNVSAIKRKSRDESMWPSQVYYYNSQIENKNRKIEFFRTVLKQLSRD